MIEEYVKIVFEKLNVLQKKSQSQKSFLSLLDSTEKIQKTVDVGKSIVDSVHTSTPVGNEGQTFTAEIQTLIMENFMSVQGKLEISFASLNDGIWIIDGSNGSGKSTIFEAIVWCQFGSYLRDGMTANDCINDKAKECRVWLEYENGFIIERTRKRGSPSSIQTYQRDPLTGHPTYISENEKGTTADSQKRINQILGIDCETFVKSVVMSQNTVNNFFSGNLQRRREIVEEMLGLGGLEGYVENARAARQEKEKLVDKYTEEIQRLCFDRDALIRATSEIERSIEMNMRELSEVEKMKNTEREIWMKGNLGSLMDEKDTLQQQKSKETSDIEYTKEYLLKDVQEVAQSLESSRNVIQQLYTLKESLIKALDIQDRKICSGCGRPIDNREQHELHTKQLFEEIKAINSIIPEQHLPAFSITDLQSALLYFNEAILKLKEHVERQESLLLGHKRNEFKISNLQMSMATLELRLSQNHNQILQVESNFANHIKEIETQLLKLQLEIQHKERNVAQNRQKMKEFCVRIEEIDQALQNERTQFELLKFWEISFDRKSKTTTGFSSFRSFLFEGAITELNLILQQYMEQLSLDYSRDLSATLDSELELVEHYGKKSGGERKRTDLAILFSLFEMVLDHSRYQPAFVLLDEVFDALDFSGRVAVQSVLSTISKRVKKVFVITHSDIALGASIAGTFSVKMSVNNEGEALGTEISINHV
uniref:RecF/RecN/SMC N-terminal domain-containing protein n=1 Tax=Arcella intermedia TaxID=1963864 RepID=A0A6B2KYN9_9EUKA